MIEESELRAVLLKSVPGAERVDVVDSTGTGDHFEAVVVARGFEGKSRVERHRLVYAALGDLMKKDVHALALKTLTPEEDSK
jgi:stress-induced morphogen